MKQTLFSIFFVSIITVSATGQYQNEALDRLSVKLLYGRNVVNGVHISVKDTPIETVTDFQGLAHMRIPKDKNILVIDVLSSYLELEIVRPVDSIVFNMKSKYAVYYYMNIKQARKKQHIPDF
jgi:hypothetical protein